MSVCGDSTAQELETDLVEQLQPTNMLQSCLLRCVQLLPTKYETPRVARMPSKPLAAANACIVAFVGLFYIAYMFKSQKYLALEAPDGTARLQLKAVTPEPGFPGFLDADHLPYCDGGTPEPDQIGNIAGNFSGVKALTRPCQYRDEFFAGYPQVEHNALFATTRVTEKVQRVPANCASTAGRQSKECVEWITDSTDVFFVSQLEDFTLLIDHSFIAPLAKASAASFDQRVEAGWICRVCDDEELLSTCSNSCDIGDVSSSRAQLDDRRICTSMWSSYGCCAVLLTRIMRSTRATTTHVEV